MFVETPPNDAKQKQLCLQRQLSRIKEIKYQKKIPYYKYKTISDSLAGSAALFSEQNKCCYNKD